MFSSLQIATWGDHMSAGKTDYYVYIRTIGIL